MGVNYSKMLLSVGAGGAATLIIYSMWRMERQPPVNYPIMGLRNCGNSCFLNAILQALASCRFMLGWLRQKDEDCNQGLPRPVTALESYNGISYPLIAAMFRAIKIMNKDIEVDENVYASKVPGDVLSGLRFNGHKIGVQQEQDAYEVFLLIAMALNHEVELSVRRNQTGSMSALTDGRIMMEEPLPWSVSEEVIPPVDLSAENGEWAVIGESVDYRVTDRIYSKRQVEMKWNYKASPKAPFRCLMFSQMQCLVCMHKTNARLETTDALTLTLPQPDTSVGLNVHDLLIRFMRPSLVHSVDCDSCTHKALGGIALLNNQPKSKSTFFKYNYMAKLPNTLCLHIPRCTWGPYGMLKRTEFVAFPERINLGLLKRLYDSNPQDHEYNAHKIFKQEPDSECNLRRFKNSEYHLMAVISHVGSAVESGHFITFRRVFSRANPNNSSWYYVSDDLVQPVPQQCVMSCRAYMLFYEKTFVNV